METWKDVVGCEGVYKVSDLGRVMKVATGLILKTGQGGHSGYAKVELYGRKPSVRRYVHHLVLEAFVGPRRGKAECRHIDGDPSNNALVNLAWGTHIENELDKYEHGTRSRRVPKQRCTHSGPRRKLTPEQFDELLKDKRGGMTQRQCAAKYGMSKGFMEMLWQGRIKHRGEPVPPEGYRTPLPNNRVLLSAQKPEDAARGPGVPEQP